MNFKTTYVLGGILAGLLVVLGLVLWLGPLPADTSTAVFPSLHSKGAPFSWQKFDQVEIDRGEGGKLVFERDPKTKQWSVNGYPANSANVNELVESICEARRVPAEKPQSLKDWHLDPPEVTVTLKSSDPPREIKLSLGAESPGDQRTAVRYVLSSDRGKEAMAVSKDDLRLVDEPVAIFRNRELVAADGQAIVAIKASQGKKELIALARKDGARWQFSYPFSGDAETAFVPTEGPPARTIKSVPELTAALAELKVSYRGIKDNGFVEDDVKDPGKKYGLDPALPDVLRLEVSREETVSKGDDKTETVVTPVKLLVSLKEKVGINKDSYYARLENGKSVVRVPAAVVDRIVAFLKDPDALRDRRLARLPDLQALEAVEIGYGGKHLKFRRVGAEKIWQLQAGGPSLTVDPKALGGLITLLTQAYPKMGFPPRSDEAALGVKDAKDASAVVSLFVEDNEDKKDKDKEKEKDQKDKDKKESGKDEKATRLAVRLTFGKTVTGEKGDKLVAVKRQYEGEKEYTLVLVPEVVLERVREGPLAYADPTLPQYNRNLRADVNVTKLVLEHNGTVTEISREKDGAPWKFVKPTPGRQADAQAVLGILHAMNTLKAVRLHAETATEKELEDIYGLMPPKTRVRITVNLNGKPTVFTYEFGRGLPTRQDQLYARQVFPEGQGKRDMIFVVNRDSLTPLDRELQDLTVFQFALNDARGLKIAGWRRTATDTPFTFELESAEGVQWKVKKPENFPLNNTPVVELAGYLSTLKAEGIVDMGGAGKAVYGLSAKANSEVTDLEVTLRGEKEPLKLTVGKAQGDRGYYAKSSRTGDDVLLIPKWRFDELKKTPDFFKKS